MYFQLSQAFVFGIAAFLLVLACWHGFWHGKQNAPGVGILLLLLLALGVLAAGGMALVMAFK